MTLTLRMRMREQKHPTVCQTSLKQMERSQRPSLMTSEMLRFARCRLYASGTCHWPCVKTKSGCGAYMLSSS